MPSRCTVWWAGVSSRSSRGSCRVRIAMTASGTSITTPRQTQPTVTAFSRLFPAPSSWGP